MKIAIIGTGYVGLVSGACLAELGNDVLCLDADEEKIAKLKQGEVPIYEPGLEPIVQRNVAAGRLKFTTDVAASVAHGVAQFIAVGTPPGKDGSADLSYVTMAAKNIGQYMDDYRVVVNKSTVPVGTAQHVSEVIGQELAKRNVKFDYSVVSNPEFLKEGDAVEDFMRPDRVILGSNDERATKIMRTIYAPLQRNHYRMMIMDVKSAELTKYASNAMLATRISFMNELANLAEELGADIDMVRQGMGSDPRIGYHFLYPGCGYGGSCFPKDVTALYTTAKQHGVDLQVLKAVETANSIQKQRLLFKINKRFGKDLKNKHFAIWGLAFKPNTNDMREAPSLSLIEGLLRNGATVTGYDPVAMEEAKKVLGKDIKFAESPMSALDGADALAIVTEWKEFRSPDFPEMKSRLKNPTIFDGRNLYDPEMVRASGFEYFAIGRL